MHRIFLTLLLLAAMLGNAQAQNQSGVANPVANLSDLIAELDKDNSDEFLHPDEAFIFTADADGDTISAAWVVAEGYYLYRDKTSFSLGEGATAKLGTVELPRGKVKEDEFFGRVEIWETDRQIAIPVVRQAAGQASDVTLFAKYQGCAEAGICYPPITKQVNLTLPPSGGAGSTSTAAAVTQAVVGAPQTPIQQANAPMVSEQDRIANALASGSVWLTVLSFFGFGLLLAFTPCVFPMIPILSGIVIGQGEKITTSKAFFLSLTYVLAMALTYTIAGVVVGLSGENVQIWFQNPWVLSIFAGIFVLLSLAMFGFYELQMPAAVQSRLTQISNSQEGGTFVGAGVMGFLSALIVGPCVTAPLVGALIYIAQTGDGVLGGMALLALSLGMGAPLIVIGTSAGKLMPKAGPWMDAIKAVFGVLLLGVAIWLLERILPFEIIMVLAGVLLIVSGIYLGAFEAIKEAASGWFRLWKGMGQVMFIYGAILLVGAAAGGHSLLQPLQGVLVAGGGPTQGAHAGLEFRQIKGLNGLEQALQNAAQRGQPVVLDLYADWCVTCKEMEAFTFTDTNVQAALGPALLIQADVTDNDEQDRQLLKMLGVFGPPAILFYDGRGQEQQPYRVMGFMGADDFTRHIKSALGDVAVAKL